MKEQHAKAQAFLISLLDKHPQLPYEPGLLPVLFSSTRSGSNTSIDSIAMMINRSPQMATRILRVANSAYYGFERGVSSLAQAVRILGLNEVRNMVVSLGANAVFAGESLPADFDMEKFWKHQLLTAVLARELCVLAAEFRVPGVAGLDKDELYVAGLLHDMGKLMLAARCPDDWQNITRLAQEKKVHFFEAEDSYWGIDHSVVASRLLCYWKLPESLAETVGWHHAPQLAPQGHAAAARVLAVANILAAFWGTHAESAAEHTEMPLPPPIVISLLPAEIPADIMQSRLQPHATARTITEMASFLARGQQ